jgi:hypothetical protein
MKEKKAKRLVLGTSALLAAMAGAPDIADAQTWCEQAQCGCTAPGGYYTSSYSCVCGGGSQTRQCNYYPIP